MTTALITVALLAMLLTGLAVGRLLGHQEAYIVEPQPGIQYALWSRSWATESYVEPTEPYVEPMHSLVCTHHSCGRRFLCWAAEPAICYACWDALIAEGHVQQVREDGVVHYYLDGRITDR